MHKILKNHALPAKGILAAILMGASSFSAVAQIPAASAPLQPAYAPLHWIRAEGINTQLPYSLQVYLTKDPVGGRPFRACYVITDPHDLTVDYTAQVGKGKRYTPSAFYKMEGDPAPYIVVNGGLFSTVTNRNLELVIRERQLVAYNQTAIRMGDDSATAYHYVTPSVLGINGARRIDVGWIFTDSTRDYPLMMLKGPSDPRYSKGRWSNPSILDIRSENANAEIGAKTMQWPMETAIGGGPTLVKRGQVFISSREEVWLAGKENELEARTAMGYTKDNKLIILCIESGYPGQSSGATLPEVAAIMKDLGCWEALNMGGGDNSCLLINGRSILRPSGGAGAPGEEAPVSSVFIIKPHQ